MQPTKAWVARATHACMKWRGAAVGSRRALRAWEGAHPTEGWQRDDSGRKGLEPLAVGLPLDEGMEQEQWGCCPCWAC